MEVDESVDPSAQIMGNKEQELSMKSFMFMEDKMVNIEFLFQDKSQIEKDTANEALINSQESVLTDDGCGKALVPLNTKGVN